MRKLLLVLAIVFVLVGSSRAQIRYAWSDSIAVTATAKDSAFVVNWETAHLWFRGCTGLIRFAMTSADTTGWDDKQWIILDPNTIFSITKHKDLGVAGLDRLEFKAASGTGALFIVGTKRSAQ